MKKWHLVAAVVATNFIAAPAFAQFTGPRIEGRLGYEAVEATIGTGDPTETGSEDAIAYGAEIGYDLQLGPAVVGAYAGLEGSNLRTCEEVFGDDEGCVGQGRNLYVGVRAGFAVAPRAMIYAKGGYSNGSVEITYESDDFDFDASDSFGGYHLGVGAELALTGGIYGRIEYVHTGTGEFRFDPETFGELSRNQAMVGVGLRF